MPLLLDTTCSILSTCSGASGWHIIAQTAAVPLHAAEHTPMRQHNSFATIPSPRSPRSVNLQCRTPATLPAALAAPAAAQ